MLGRLVVCASLVVVACGGDDESSGGGSGATGSGGTGASATGGTSGSGGTIATGGAGGTVATGGVTGTGATDGGGAAGTASCSEQPCKLVLPQCGCGAGKACVLLGSERKCEAAGNVPSGLECQATGSCQAGYGCYNMLGTVPTCTKFCASNADCEAPGGICIDKNTGVKLCTQNCDPFTSAGCPMPGTKCVLANTPFGSLTNCWPAGTKQVGASCGTDSECPSGSACLPTGSSLSVTACLAFCDMDSPACPTSTTCTTFVTVGTVHYGYCKPN